MKPSKTTNVNFAIHRNKNVVVYIDPQLWESAFNYAMKNLQIEYLHARIDCLFIPMNMERGVKFKYFSAGATGTTDKGAMFYVIAEKFLTDGSMVRTFFHEMTHVKQLLMRELIVKPRHQVWKGEKWHRREYSFAPWEVEARAFADKAYDGFIKQEVTKRMANDNVHAYHPAIISLHEMFPPDDVFRITQELHRERESRQQNNIAGHR
jgi:hypothetical protein